MMHFWALWQCRTNEWTKRSHLSSLRMPFSQILYKQKCMAWQQKMQSEEFPINGMNIRQPFPSFNLSNSFIRKKTRVIVRMYKTQIVIQSMLYCNSFVSATLLQDNLKWSPPAKVAVSTVFEQLPNGASYNFSSIFSAAHKKLCTKRNCKLFSSLKWVFCGIKNSFIHAKWKCAYNICM